MNCIQCRRALGMLTSTSGMIASCSDCDIEHISLGRLMGLADSRLLIEIWAMIQTSHSKNEWQQSQACPRCSKTTFSVPFRRGTQEHGLIVCPSCYSVAMKSDTLRFFSETKPEFKANQIAEKIANDRRIAQQKFEEELRMDLDKAKHLLTLGVKTADHLLNETPLKEIKTTVLVAFACVVFSSVTMLLPFASMEAFGSNGHSALLASLAHLTFFHLMWNLIFFCAVSASVERDTGTFHHLIFLVLIAPISIAIGQVISPFPSAPVIGLSPVIGALLGRQLALGLPIHFRIPNSKAGIILEPRIAMFFFLLSELRTIIPTSGGMKWFTLTAVLAAWGISAAYTEWKLKRLNTNDKQERRMVTVISAQQALSARENRLKKSA